MKNTKYSNAPQNLKNAISQSEIVEDFLPPPETLIHKEENVKITLELSKRSISSFKKYAKRKGLPYQKMIRNLVDQYAEKILQTEE